MTSRDVLASSQTKRGILPLILALLLITGLALLLLFALPSYLSVSEVELPDVVGLDISAAEAQLGDMGLGVITYTDTVREAQINAVTAQTPTAGALVRRGRNVALGVNIPDIDVDVPRLIGNTEAQANTILGSIGLELGEINYAFSDRPEGEIVSQLPTAGITLATGERINVTVSRGQELAKVIMPEVRGLSVEEAKRRLAGVGLRNVEPRAASVSFDRPNVVVAQLPMPGQALSPSTRTVLGFSLPASQVVPVPSLVGIPLSQAQASLYAAGLSLGAVTYITDPAQPPGIITYAPSSYTVRGAPIQMTVNRAGLSEPITNLSTTPQPVQVGPPVQPQTPVTSTVTTSPQPVEQVQPTVVQQPTSSSQVLQTPLEPSSTTSAVPADGARIIPFNFDPSNLGMAMLLQQEYKLRLEVADERGERIILERVVPAGQAVSTNISVYGSALLQTYINDILFQAWNP